MSLLSCCDFHQHTDRSDGFLTPRQLLAADRENGIGCMSFTDHNVVMEEEELDALRQEFPDIRILSGCEFSSCHKQLEAEIHVIGIDFRLTDEMRAFLAGNRLTPEQEAAYVTLLIENLRRAGLPYQGSYEELKRRFPQQHVGRAVLVRDVLRQGLLPGWTVEMVFDRYVGDHPGPKLASTPKPRVFHSTAQCAQAIRKAGGIPILAHPLAYGLDEGGILALMQDFADAGGIGVEVYYARYSPEEQAMLARLAAACHPTLLPSAASDFHNWDSCSLANHFPTQKILPPLLERRDAEH